MTEPDIKGVQVPIRLQVSHGVERRGFTSARRGTFATRDPAAEGGFAPTFEANEFVLLDTAIRHFRIAAPAAGDWQNLSIEFDSPQAIEGIETFLSDLANALSAAMAPKQKDAWYGNLFVEIRLAEIELVYAPAARNEGLHIADSLSMASHHFETLSSEQLEGLRASALNEIFVDGMRAAQIKSKFIYWFVLLEELERRPEFDSLSERLYTSSEVVDLLAKCDFKGKKFDRLQQFLKGKQLTIEPRHEKLSKILKKIGVTTIESLGKDINITPALCKTLIEQRNKVAHRGSCIDPSQVYTVLFPLAYSALCYMINAEASQVATA